MLRTPGRIEPASARVEHVDHPEVAASPIEHGPAALPDARASKPKAPPAAAAAPAEPFRVDPADDGDDAVDEAGGAGDEGDAGEGKSAD